MQKQPPSCEKWLCVRRWLLSNRDCMTIDSRAFHRSPHRRRRVGAHRCRVVGSPHGRRVVGTGTATTQTIPLHGLVLESPLAFDGDGDDWVAAAVAVSTTSATNFRPKAEEGDIVITLTVQTPPGTRPNPGRKLRAVGPLEAVGVHLPVQEDGNLDTLTRVHLGHLAGSAPPAEDHQNQHNEANQVFHRSILSCYVY